MSRRSQQTRRRSYGRRQHEVRQRREGRINGDWSAQLTEEENSANSRSDSLQLPGTMEAGHQ